MAKISIKGEIVTSYLSKFKNTPDQTLAKKVYEENKKVFDSLEQVRDIIRYYRGHKGQKDIKKLTDKRFIKPVTYNTNPFDIPESDEREPERFSMPIANDNILFLSDIHLPYHKIGYINKALEYGKNNLINTIWLNGDIMDCYQASAHEKDPRKRNLKGEIATCRSFLESLRKHFPNASIYYKEGNHEVRWKRYLMRHAAQLLDMEEFRLDVVLRLAELDIHWIPNKTIVNFGKLHVFHGNEVLGGGGVDPARSLFLKVGDNVIAGDKHKTKDFVKTTINKEENTKSSHSVACLCELNPDYMGLALEWNNGFARVILKKDGSFIVENKRFVDNKIV